MNDSSRNRNIVLIVDDNPTNLDVLFDYLDNSGFEVFVAENGEDAVEQSKYARPDIILLDVMMPGIDGFETCRRLKKIPETQNIPVIFMTALSDTNDKVKGFEVGAIDYITKPLQHEEVLARVTTHLTIRNLQKELESQNIQLQQEITWRKQIEDQLITANNHLRQLNDRLQTDLALAREIQQTLLPAPQPDWPGLKAFCYTAPAREVGGDFYTYHVRSKEYEVRSMYAFAVGDVSGKGMPAALLMAVSIALLQAVIAENISPSLLLTHLNQDLLPYTKASRQNCALCYAEITLPTANEAGILRVANAGCVMPIIRHANGGAEWADASGVPLGMELASEIGYAESTLPLQAGDLIILTSDGVIEATNQQNELFGFGRLEQAVIQGPPADATAMMAHLQAEVADFVGDTEPHDDLTIVVVEVGSKE